MKYTHISQECEQIAKVYSVGIKVLEKIKTNLENREKCGIIFREVDKSKGELFFSFVGAALYAKIKVFNRKDKHIGKVTWGRYIIKGEEPIREQAVCENIYEQESKDQFRLWYEKDDPSDPLGFGDLAELVFNNISKVLKDLFQEIDEQPPKRPESMYVEV